MTVSFIILSLSAVITVLLGATVLFQQPRQAIGRHFFLLAISIAGWTMSNALFTDNVDESTRFSIALVSYGFAAILALGFLLFCMDLSTKKYSKSIAAMTSVAGIAVAVVSMIPGVVAHGVDGLTVLTRGSGLAVYGVTLLLFLGAGLWLLIDALKIIRSQKHRDRIAVVLLGLCVGVAIGVSFNLIMPLLGNYSFVQFGPLGSMVLVIACAYAIVKHGLFDLKLAAARTAAYVLTLGLLALIYVIVTIVVSSWIVRYSASSRVPITSDLSAVNITTTLGLVFLFQPVKQFFDKLTSKVFYRKIYDKDEFYAEISNTLTTTTDLRPLLRNVSRLLVKTFDATQAFFFVYRDERHLSAGSEGYSKIPIKDARWLDEFVKESSPEDLPIMIDQLLDSDRDTAIRRFMISYRLTVILPLVQGGQIVGYLFLGDQRRGGYVVRDRLVLRTISSELIIAIQNALSIQEVRDLNETLQQRIDEATQELRISNAQLKKLDEAKDEFISMASHQLRTPLTSIKGYIDMMLEGDAGKITPTQHQFLTEAFMSSERMVHLINDFLSLSRLQTGKFVIEKRPTDLAKLVRQEIDSLKVNAAGRQLSFKLSIGKSIPQLMLDEAKIRQVVMNFADNALYYSPAGSAIDVSLELDGDEVFFRVKDKGIGVPKDEQSRLFSKFFRAANARKQRPDGTGVGLYLAKRVITEHGGQVLFVSTEGKGSTFGFRLPLRRLGVPDSSEELDNQPDNN